MRGLAWQLGLLVTGGLALAGCAGDRAATSTPQSGGAQLPAVESLPQSRKASYTDADRRKTGSAYDNTLPANGVADAGGGKLTFAALADGNDDALTDYAFALYSFVLPGYQDNAVIQLNWESAPEEGTAWIALANRDSLRWDWQDATLGGPVDFGMLLPYIEADNLTLAVIVGGSQSAELSSIIVGTNTMPAPFVTVSPDNGEVPLTVDFSGALSSDSDGNIVKFEWDFDDDGVYDLDSGTDATVSHTYSVAGSYTPRMRVTDDKGAQARDGENVSANAPGMVPPVADLLADPPSGPLPLEVTLDASGSTDDFGIVNYDFDFTGNGEFDVLNSPSPTVTHTYSTGGLVTAVVRVEDADGATDTASVVIDVDAIAEVVFSQISPLCGPGERTLKASGYEEGGNIVQYRWDFEDDGTWDQTTTSNQVTHSYSWGVYFPKVEATDDDGDTAVDTYGHPLLAQQWAAGTLPAGSGDRAGPSVLQIGNDRVGVFEASAGLHYWGPTPHYISTSVNPPDVSVLKLGYINGSGGTRLPFVVFYSAGGDLRIARAGAGPDATADWTIHNIRSSSSSFDGNYSLAAASYGSGINARVVVSYFDDEDNDLGFAFSENSNPDEESDWTVHAVDSSNAGKFHALELFGGIPSIIYADMPGPNSTLRYARANSANPDDAADWTSYVLWNALSTSDPFRGLTLASVGGTPAATWVASNGQLTYLRATVADPTAQNQWQSHGPLGSAPVGFHPALAEISGRAALAYTRTDAANPILKFAWAKDAAPDHENDWCLSDVPNLSGIFGFHTALATFDGKPLIGLHTEFLDVSQQTIVWGQ